MATHLEIVNHIGERLRVAPMLRFFDSTGGTAARLQRTILNEKCSDQKHFEDKGVLFHFLDQKNFTPSPSGREFTRNIEFSRNIEISGTYSLNKILKTIESETLIFKENVLWWICKRCTERFFKERAHFGIITAEFPRIKFRENSKIILRVLSL